MKPSGGPAPFSKSLALAILIHAAGLVFVAYQSRSDGLSAPAPAEPLLWFDLPVEPELPAAEPPPADGADDSPAVEERTALFAPRERAMSHDAEAQGAEGLALPPADPGAGDAPSDSVPAERPPMTLEQLGLGESKLFWNKEIPKPLSRHARVEKRLRQSLGTAIAQQDQKRGLGPEGPVVSRLETETRAGLTPPNSAALFRAVTDRSGRIVSLVVISSSSDRRHWDKIAARALAALAGTKLRNSAPNGVTFEIRVVSRVQLPSGADPGFSLRAGGVPVTKGGGSRSASVDILPFDGEVFETEIPEPSANGAIVPNGIQTGRQLGAQGDLADLGAVAQRMVRAFVERLWANEPPPEPPKSDAPN